MRASIRLIHSMAATWIEHPSAPFTSQNASCRFRRRVFSGVEVFELGVSEAVVSHQLCQPLADGFVVLDFVVRVEVHRH